MTASPVSSAQLFRAEWPRELDPRRQSLIVKVAKVYWDIISVVIFPIGIARFLISRLRNICFLIAVPGNALAPEFEGTLWERTKLIARLFFNPEVFKIDRTAEGEEFVRKHHAERFPIHTPDGAILDAAFIPGQYRDKVILIGGGNAEQWETYLWVDRLKSIGTSFLCVNPRGVGKSIGIRSAEGYALDVYSAYEYLIREKGIDPENILLIGYSMGAANGTNGAALIQQKYPRKKISVISLCSFSSLVHVIHDILHKRFPNVSSLVTAAAQMIGLDIDVGAAWKRLRGKKCFFFNRADEMIPYPSASIASVAEVGSHAVEMYSHYPNPHLREMTLGEKHRLELQVGEYLNLGPSLSAAVMSLTAVPVHTVSRRG